jgi:aerotaxis receptor
MDIKTTEIRKVLPTIDQEVPFSFEELFFSRTDAGGVILSGNSVFQRISMFSWGELIKKPHNVIRHPDMPRAVFWLLWQTIEKGEPIGAYVKNRAKNGQYYWVFAIVTPIEGGYLSVRLKPSALLSVVDAEYKSLLALAIQQKLKPKDSAAILLKRLAELGFEDYRAFMAAALSKELAARDQQLGREPNSMIMYFDELAAKARSLLERAQTISNAYLKVRFVPLNLTVQAAQLGEGGATISVISNNYNAISAEIKDNMNRFFASAQRVLQTINDGQFLICAAIVQSEVAEFFKTETATAEFSQEQEMLLLQQQHEAYRRKAVDGLKAIRDQAAIFERDCAEMRHLATSLEVTRVMGKVESSRLAARDGLDALIDELDSFQTAIATGLKEIDGVNQSIRQNSRRILDLIDGSA